MNKATKTLSQILSLMSALRQLNSIDGIELPDTIKLDTKDFVLIGDSIAAAIIFIELAENQAMKGGETRINPELDNLLLDILLSASSGSEE